MTEVQTKPINTRADILKVDFLRGQNFSFVILFKNKCKSQDFAQSNKFFAQSHDHETRTFRNSAQEKQIGII